MSRNEWERGEIKVSTKEFSAVRRDLIAAHNGLAARFFLRAKTVYAALKLAGKGTRNFDWRKAFDGCMVSGEGYSMSAHDIEGYDEIYRSIFPYEEVEVERDGRKYKTLEQSRKPKSPKRTAFNPLKTNATQIEFEEAYIGFDRKRRVIIWNVNENNHSVDRARNHAMGKQFFYRMSRVEWVRGTGGEIVGNDEYNQDNRSSGGGANYTTATFGKVLR